ncbi:SIMPL domain-containing protein [Sandarakinorhabdus cyanobacteriorum]|uniref:SIMPL domain-containing protein n=1 Tax=Sandarakinorhabdus cyanobacteriorum TaxID=1981098 RepID=A0A255YR07_9SPHN|nr:SIMPL domain-containing protein [Sandarakinorhabdus cyanobacteriorum]OYQ31144.1 SIMPL domain-containing protein [Sandarakinorhabdus cyanobacteriorum]
MKHSLALLAAIVASAAAAQTPPATIGQPFIPAPWWMKDPVIAAMGHVRTEVPANRAAFAARFSVVGKTAADATTAATAKARELDAALAALGKDKLRLTTSLATRPLYEQYRTRDGQMQENARADQIEAYEVTAVLQVEVRDTAVLERAYRLSVAARPSAIDQVRYSLDESNELKTWLYEAAVKDAARRARLATTAAGGRLGPVKVIDPSGGVCQTQVLAGWPSYGAGGRPQDVEAPAFEARAAMDMPAPAVMAPPPPPSLEKMAEAVQVTLTPPLYPLNAEACVIYGLSPAP